MKEYALLFKGGLDFETATPDQIQQAVKKWRAWIDQLTKDGIYAGGHRLMNESTAIQGTKKQIFDGPHTESKEIVGGFISIKVADKQQALTIAQDCPILQYDGIVEIREIAKM